MSELIERAKALLEGVTEGVWAVDPVRGGHYGVRGGKYQLQVVYAHSDWEGYGNGSTKADAEFIAASRQLVPELIAEVERLAEQLADMANYADLLRHGAWNGNSDE
ncbi:hypothetical protein [Mycobacteroides chelonae]|uniref:hypothetical protein n=1 Tax=Mycobacteroides chelonae TaxID=1774 RepID=UPI000AFB5405|nr:hypothetical protein [Mycobacteroides chelonae]